MRENLNLALVEGNLVRDPEYHQTKKGMPLCKFDIATNDDFLANGEKVSNVYYIGVTTWNKTADACSKYLKKGKRVRVSGKLHQDRWQDKEGKSRQKLYINASKVNFLSFLKKDDHQDNDKKGINEVIPF